MSCLFSAKAFCASEHRHVPRCNPESGIRKKKFANSNYPAIQSRYVFRRGRSYTLTCSANSMAELIPYVPVNKNKVYDLRLYNAYPVAETSYVRRDEGFLLLGEYMTGANSTQTRMKETQPIVMCYYPEVCFLRILQMLIS